MDELPQDLELDDSERVFLLELHNTLTQRLHLLKLRKARQGNDTPESVLMEISSTEQELRLVEIRMRRRRLGQKVLDAVGQDVLYLELSIRLDETMQLLQGLSVQVGDLAEAQDATKQRVQLIEQTTRGEAEARKPGQQTTRRLLIGVLIVEVVFMFIVLLLVRILV